MTLKNDKIQKSFRQGTRKVVKTVGALIRELQQLPFKMKIEHGFGRGVRVTVTNCNDRYLAVVFEEVEDE